jgi:probable H4MPT-linked C1 transfer pathway protein
MPRAVLALDIGGANLKAAHSAGATRLQPFELWKQPAALPRALGEIINTGPRFDLLAVTMTGELCDCFETKRQGVNGILDAVACVGGGIPVRVWQTDGRLVEPAAARAAPLKAAAANWLALATFAGRFAAEGAALVLDIGSTTTDVIPLQAGKPVPRGRTDPERLRSLELVYTGVRRTPLCALLGCGAAAEVFATTLDVYLLLGNMPEDPADRGTADGRPATRAAAHARLARMLCADAETCSEEEARKLALRASQRQVYWVQSAVEHVAGTLAGPLQTVVLAGAGEFLARALLQLHADFSSVRVVSLAEQLGLGVSQAACAYALAVLAAERAGGGT